MWLTRWVGELLVAANLHGPDAPLWFNVIWYPFVVVYTAVSVLRTRRKRKEGDRDQLQ